MTKKIRGKESWVMGIEGHLKIDLHRKGKGIASVVVSSDRPMQIARLFIGKTAAQTLQTIPLIFSVCAMAQSSAAVSACERAAGCAQFEDTRKAREIIVMAESIREHLLRIVLDWPQFISDVAKPINIKALMKLPEAMSGALFTSNSAFETGARPQVNETAVKAQLAELDEFLNEQIFGEDIALWRERTSYQALKIWAEDTDTIAAALVRHIIEHDWMRSGYGDTGFLPPIANKDMQACLLRDDNGAFTAQPTWNNAPLETSVLSRQIDAPLIKALLARFGTGLLTRLCARLCELARLPQDILTSLEKAVNSENTVQSPQQNEGFGLAQIEAARGRLVHMVRIECGVIKDYRILAPTEWNFHPAGPAASGLARLDAASEEDLKMQASLLINAIDPCVGFEVRVH